MNHHNKSVKQVVHYKTVDRRSVDNSWKKTKQVYMSQSDSYNDHDHSAPPAWIDNTVYFGQEHEWNIKILY